MERKYTLIITDYLRVIHGHLRLKKSPQINDNIYLRVVCVN